jgi:hypothetical protein
MLLGDLLTRFADPELAAEAILASGDLSLLVRMREQAAAEGMDLGAYAAAAVQLYSAQASDEEWITLMGALSRASDPGLVCLQRAFAYAVAAAEPCGQRL